jgi:hypothetical protein
MTKGEDIIASSIFRAESSLYHQSKKATEQACNVHPTVKINRLLTAGDNKTCSLIKHVLFILIPTYFLARNQVVRREEIKLFTNQQP